MYKTENAKIFSWDTFHLLGECPFFISYSLSVTESLYLSANILAATKKDFEPANRKKLCSRIAMRAYAAVTIGLSRFEGIPLSEERQMRKKYLGNGMGIIYHGTAGDIYNNSEGSLV